MSTPDQRVRELLSRPSVEALIYALRHRETWPEGFEWKWINCRTCAMGLAFNLWAAIGVPIPPYVGRVLDMSVADAEKIFFHTYMFFRERGVPLNSATILPEHVASALERWLEERV